jgi:hypothetical protein
MGYHPGLEDDGVYLTAIKADLNPSLYPHDQNFFELQLQATLFDGTMARGITLTGIPVAWAELLVQFGSIFLILWSCLQIAKHLFADATARWAGVAFTSAMMTLPVAGTALCLVDQHLHPRNVATALILFAVSRILAEKRWQAVPLLLLAFAFHPIMAAMGISFCFFLTFVTTNALVKLVGSFRGSAAALVPLGWLFESPTPVWHRALETRSYFFLSRWSWYELLGAFAPLFLFGLLGYIARRQGKTKLAQFAVAVFAYGVFQQAVAIVILTSPALIRLTPLQPMRFLHLIYFFLTLVAGCMIGQYILRDSAWRWALFLLLTNGSMFASQRALYSSSEHLEVPGRQTSNPWVQSFAWIRQNTPTSAYFAMDPNYLAAPGEDYHSFRALAERSQLADAIKDTSVVTQVPELGPVWQRQVDAAHGWNTFQLNDFERLKSDFGVDWVLVSHPPPAGLDCKWHNNTVSVCQIPAN